MFHVKTETVEKSETAVFCEKPAKTEPEME